MKKGEKNEAFLAWVKSDLSKERSLLRGISTLLYRDMGHGGGIFLADFADRDEVLQELVGDLLEHPEDYARALGHGKPGPWICRVFKNRIQDRQRSCTSNPKAYLRKKMLDNLGPPELFSFSFKTGSRARACYRNTAPGYAPLHLTSFFLSGLDLPLSLASLSADSWKKRVWQIKAALALWEMQVDKEAREDFSIEKDAVFAWLWNKTDLREIYASPQHRIRSLDEPGPEGREGASDPFPLPAPLLAPFMEDLVTFGDRDGMTRLRELLSPEEFQVLEALADGMPQGELAARLGCSDARVSSLKRKIADRLRPVFSPEELLLLLQHLGAEGGRDEE